MKGIEGMRKKSIVYFPVILMCLFILASCGTLPSTTDHSSSKKGIKQPANDNNSESKLVNLLISDNLKVSEDLISQFFQYYCMNTHELSMLPTFSSSKQADWDQFTLYIYLNSVCPRNEAKYENFDSKLTKEKFAETASKYFGKVNYTDHESSYLDYADGIYSIKNGDPGRHGYYRLVDISKNTNGIYTAVFDGLFFGESEYSDLYQDASPNIKAIRDAAGTTESMQMAEFNKTTLDIFLKANYNKILNMTEKVTIQFTLSGNDTFPFIYKSCEITNY